MVLRAWPPAGWRKAAWDQAEVQHHQLVAEPTARSMLQAGG
jgi:hypothetical protein